MTNNAIPYEHVHEIATRFGIRLAKGQYVDMADEAVEVGRNGSFPIRLKLVSGDGREILKRDLKSPAQIRQAYDELASLLPAHPGARVLAQRERGGQRHLAIRGYVDDAGRRLIELSAPAREGTGRETIGDVLPIAEDEAQAMVARLREKHILPVDEHVLRTLADLLLRAARMFEETPLTGFTFDPVRLDAAGYEVLEATMMSAKRLGRQPRKLARREHDQKEPSGHQ